ncbi:MAG: potassium channel family protein [Rhizobiaceae bacterium]|nr:potassium channel family protein [Rhizobiaceae bacterium]MCO5073421.1 potassium channel family protein [Rhizobiaceae bacterium]
METDRSSSFRDRLRILYNGQSTQSRSFQAAVVLVDLAIIAFFIATPVLQKLSTFLWIDYSVAALLSVDILARLLASSDIPRRLRQPTVWVDIFIFVTLLFPATFANLGFLRILRLWSLSRSGFLWRPLQSWGISNWREPIHAVVNLLTFLFVATGFIYTFYFRTGAGVAEYVDALYFTVATVTTTGFGDIVLPGISGKLTAIVTMIVGISLFVRLAQSIFKPEKVFFPCPQCALQRHDPDAVYCKACGHAMKIPDPGD